MEALQGEISCFLLDLGQKGQKWPFQCHQVVSRN